MTPLQQGRRGRRIEQSRAACRLPLHLNISANKTCINRTCAQEKRAGDPPEARTLRQQNRQNKVRAVYMHLDVPSVFCDASQRVQPAENRPERLPEPRLLAPSSEACVTDGGRSTLPFSSSSIGRTYNLQSCYPTAAVGSSCSSREHGPNMNDKGATHLL